VAGNLQFQQLNQAEIWEEEGNHVSGKPSSRSLARGLWAPALLLCAAVPAAWAGPSPTLLSITPDGQFEDWASARANVLNVTQDGDGATVPCPETSDRDCVVASNSGDLDYLVWTYDPTSLYLLVKRFASANGSDSFFLHVDRDRDGRVQTDEPIVRFRYTGNNGTVSLTVYDYVAALPGGDPIVDALGYADGYVMPGTLGISTWAEPDEATGGPNGEMFEGEIPWASLGLAGPEPVLFHLGVDNAGSAPDATEDNLGGPDRGAGDLGFLLHAVGPPRTGSYPPDEIIEHAHTITNDGSLPDAYALRAFSSEGYHIEILEDVDGDTFGDILLAVDKRGDGDFLGSQDELYRDDDGDTYPETGTLLPGESFHLVVRIVATNGAKSFFETTRLVATSLGGTNVEEVEDIVAVGWVTLQPPRQILTEAGAEVWLCHQVTNHLATRTLVDFEWTSSRGWDYTLWTDPDFDCNPSDGFPMVADSNGDGRPDLNVTSLETISLVAVATVPPAEPHGTAEILDIEADSDVNNSIGGAVTDRVTVSDILALTPSYRISDGTAKSGAPGTRLYFRHRLEHAGVDEDSFLVSVVAPGNHTARIYTDPNGDGLPTDGVLLGTAASTGPVTALGGTFPFLVAVDVDPAASPGEQFAVSVFAVSETNPTLSRTVEDEVTVANVAAYADPLHVLQEYRYPLCSTLYGRAAGIVPEQTGRYRLRWVYDAGPATLQTLPFSSDADGFGYDALALDETSPTGAYSLILEEWTGLAWQELDRDAFRVDDFGILGELRTDTDRYFIDGRDLGVTALFENDGDVTLHEQVIHFAVLSPDRSRLLQQDGAFVAVAPDLWTWTAQPFSLDPGEQRTEGFSVPSVAFPEPGTYIVQAVGEGTCGSQDALVETTFEVVEDSDGDGWRDDFEEALGTDPLDRDSDDDGIWDSLDGNGDADGDTVPDALECDADADTLPDSVEAGLVEADVDTDTNLLAGCFQADGDAGATRTDRLAPDTDWGGEADGDEDLDRDGVFDAGEKDPDDPTDDPCAWTAPPEATDLRVARLGADLLLSWSDLSAGDPCVRYEALSATTAPPTGIGDFTGLAPPLAVPVFTHVGACPDGALRYYLVSAGGRIGGGGPLGHYGQ